MKRITIKNESTFVYFAGKEEYCVPDEVGRKQFFNKQTYGNTPSTPNLYYKYLMKGKWLFDFLTSEFKKLYYSGEW